MKEVSMCKLFCTEAASQNAYNAIEIYGGMGLMEETPVARYYRDARVLTIVDGTSEIQKTIIAKQLGC